MNETDTPTTIEESQQAISAISGFWKRVFALIIDSLVLGAFGMILGIFLFDQLSQLGGWGRLVGFGIALLYFGILNSSIGKGQTLGKRLMGIHVISVSGNHISLPKSVLRYSILGIPFFLNGALIPGSVLLSPLSFVISLLIFGFGAAIIYLYIFNRKTRQSLHDLAVKTIVANVEFKDRFDNTVWKPHLAVTGVLLILSIGLPLIGQNLLKRFELEDLITVQEGILASGKAHHVSAQIGKSWGKKSGEQWEISYIQAHIILKSPPEEPRRISTEFAGVILQSHPNALKKDAISVTTSYGYDIGIASAWKSNRYSFSPNEWLHELEK